jgi:hypothetical protein
MISAGGNLHEKIAKVLEVSEEAFITQGSYASNFMRAIFQNRELVDGEYTDDKNIRLARIIYEQETG